MSLPTHNVQAEFQGGYTAKRGQTLYLAVHHAAALYRQPTGIEDVRAVATYHTKTRGWPGIGYHICLAEEINGGRIGRYNVSDLELVRAHVAWQNHIAVGVSCLTNFTGLPEQKWVDALAEVLAELTRRYPDAIIVGHKEIALGPTQSPDHKDYRTACPGPRWVDWKGDLQAQVARLLAPPKPPTPVAVRYRVLAPMWISETTSPHGPIAVSGTAIVQAGQEILIDEVRSDGYAHTADHRGFLPIGGLEKV